MSSRSGKWEVLVVGTVLAFTVGAFRAVAQGPDGADLYRQHCRSCHGAKGVPPQRMLTLYPRLKTLADPALLKTVSTDSVVAILKHGLGRDMKSFSDRLSNQEMAAVAKFVKTLADTSARGP